MAHILVVDDDELILKMARAVLQKSGHTVTVAKDGQAALQILSQELFDMVITDANMPNGVSGFSLASSVRKNDRTLHIPLMFLTGLTEKSDVARALEAGADDYMVKPIDPDVLSSKVVSLIEKKKHHYGFPVAQIEASGIWQIDFEINGLSERGLQIVSRASAIPHTKLRIDSELFEDIGIRPPQVRVVSCAPMQSRPAFHIEVNFVGLSDSEIELIRRWVAAHHKTAGAA